MESNPEPFKPHYCQLLQLLSAVLQDLDNPKTLYYCILTLTSITAYIGTAELVSSDSVYQELLQNQTWKFENDHRQDQRIF